MLLCSILYSYFEKQNRFKKREFILICRLYNKELAEQGVVSDSTQSIHWLPPPTELPVPVNRYFFAQDDHQRGCGNSLIYAVICCVYFENRVCSVRVLKLDRISVVYCIRSSVFSL